MFAAKRGRRWCRARRFGNWGSRITEQGFYGDNYFSERFRRRREAEFARIIARRIVDERATLLACRPPEARQRVLELGALALRDAGYAPRRRSPIRGDGKVSRNAAKQVRYLMGMPRVIDQIATELEAAECGPKQAAREVAKIALGKIEEEPAALGIRLRALDMIVRLTCGYVPTKQIQGNVTIPPDSFFDETEFQDTPAMAATAPEPKSVTGSGRRRGRHR